MKHNAAAQGVGYGGVGTHGHIHLSPQTQRISKKHHRETVEFNIGHAVDHLEEAVRSAKKMRAYGARVKKPKRLFQLCRELVTKAEGDIKRSGRNYLGVDRRGRIHWREKPDTQQLGLFAPKASEVHTDAVKPPEPPPPSLPVEDVQEHETGEGAWRTHNYTGRVKAGEPAIAYRGLKAGELEDAFRLGTLVSTGTFTTHMEGRTQFTAGPPEVLGRVHARDMRPNSGMSVLQPLRPAYDYVVEADVQGLPFKTLRKPDNGRLAADLGLGIGIEGGVPLDRIKRVLRIMPSTRELVDITDQFNWPEPEMVKVPLTAAQFSEFEINALDPVAREATFDDPELDAGLHAVVAGAKRTHLEVRGEDIANVKEFVRHLALVNEHEKKVQAAGSMWGLFSKLGEAEYKHQHPEGPPPHDFKPGDFVQLKVPNTQSGHSPGEIGKVEGHMVWQKRGGWHRAEDLERIPEGVTKFLSDVPWNTAVTAYSGTSMAPETRAEQARNDYAHTLAGDYAELKKLATTPEKQQALEDGFHVYREGYKRLYLSYLHSRNGLVSSMIAGPSKFPTARMEKRNRSVDNRATELNEFRKRMLHRIRVNMTPELQPIKVGASDARSRLEQKIADAEKLQATMKAANAAIRKHAKAGPEAQVAALTALGISEGNARRLLEKDFAGRIGFADYQLTNNNANIRRMKAQLGAVERHKEEIASVEEKHGGSETLHDEGGIHAVADSADERIHLTFSRRLSRDEYKFVRSAGFLWSPTRNAFVRNLNAAGRSAVQYVVGHFGGKLP